MDTKEQIEKIIDRSFERIVKELFPLGTKNAAMKRKTDAVRIIMEELEKLCE